MIPLSLYIHLPWCVQKCPYCDFNSHALRQALPEEAMVAAIIDELRLHAELLCARTLTSIFFGGGTPSLFSEQSIEQILLAVDAVTPLTDACEITLEANPGTLDSKRFSGYVTAGVNRLSLGVQSMNDQHLRKLGRIHDAKLAAEAIETVAKCGFKSWNVDLMHGLPEQTAEEALADIQAVLAFAPPHLSWYQLTIEPNTAFYKNPPPLPPDEILHDIQEKGAEQLRAHGLLHYEVSAYGKRGHTSKHNCNYWEFGDYLGIGAGAHSKMTDLQKGAISRSMQYKHPSDYLIKEKRDARLWTVVSERDLVFEFMLNALRLTDGFSVHLFSERTLLPLSAMEPMLNQAKEKGLLQEVGGRIAATTLGQRFLNDAVSLFLPQED